jgi:beta-phosphoglucomutase-like phosphatase (HAD superfamily)
LTQVSGDRAPVSRGPAFWGRGGYGAVLLDLDGCLIDSNDVHARAWSDALARFGHPIAPGRIRPEIGKGGQELLRDFLAPAERHYLGDAMGRLQTRLFLKRFGRQVRPFPGAASTVHAFRRARIPVVLASSADRTVVERSLDRLRLRGVVEGFTSADDVQKAKPFDDVFSLAISRFGLAGSHPVAVGDTPYDIGAAHQIGIPCIALLSGGFPEKLLAAAEARFTGLAQLWREGRHLFR